MSDSNIDNACLNCSHPMAAPDKYCPNCGQKKLKLKITFWSLVTEFLGTVFNLNNAAFRTFKHAFIPAKLTKAFLDGQRIRYLHPFRWLLICLFLFVAAFSFKSLSRMGQAMVNKHSADVETVNRMNHFEELQVLQDSLALTGLDSLQVQGAQNLLEAYKLDNEFFSDTIGFDDYVDWGFFILSFNINDVSKYDFVNLSTEELIEKYDIQEFEDQLLLAKRQKAQNEPMQFLKNNLSNFVWALVFMIFIIALMFKGLYFRQKRFYVEHLTFSFHIHAFFFLILSIGLLALPIRIASLFSVAFLLILFPAFLLFNLKRFYEQSWLKSLLKLFLLIIIYPFLFTIVLLITFTITFLLI